MKLIHNAFEIVMDFQNGIPNTLVVESPECMRLLIIHFQSQISGGQGGFVLSDSKMKELSLSKEAEFILDPFIHPEHNKVFSTKLIQHIRTLAHNENHFEETAEIESLLLQYAASLMQDVEESINFSDSLDTLALLKTLGFMFDFEDMSPIENIITYIKACNKYLKKRLFVFVNLKTFFTTEEILYLYESLQGMKAYMLLLENKVYNLFSSNEKCSIIDVDYCEIF